jgi:hypothetical protein
LGQSSAIAVFQWTPGAGRWSVDVPFIDAHPLFAAVLGVSCNIAENNQQRHRHIAYVNNASNEVAKASITTQA